MLVHPIEVLRSSKLSVRTQDYQMAGLEKAKRSIFFSTNYTVELIATGYYEYQNSRWVDKSMKKIHHKLLNTKIQSLAQEISITFSLLEAEKSYQVKLNCMPVMLL